MTYDPNAGSPQPWNPGPRRPPSPTHPPTAPSSAGVYVPGTVAAPRVASDPTRVLPSSPPVAAPVGGSWQSGGAGGNSLPPWPPAPSGAPHPAPDPAAPRRSGGRAGSVVAAALIAALFAGTAGGAVGATLANRSDGGSSSGGSAVATTPVSGPIKGNGDEPVEAVAAAVAPTVVQIETGEGLGSGFIYDRSGLIMTAHHVVDGSTTVTIRLADGTKLQGQVLGEDPSTDVAVVKVTPTGDLPVATLATGVTTKVGQMAVAIGSPFGLDQSVTAGIVSAVGRSAETPGGVIPAIQTDAPINPGNSGGALVDRQGRIIGINDSIINGNSNGQSGTGGNVGVGFAIPIDIAKAVADRIVAGQSTDAGFLGVEGADASGNRAGALVTSVSDGSPAAEAGLRDGDVVVAVDGRTVSSMIDLAAEVRTKQPGDRVELTVVRDGQEQTVEVTLGTAPPSN